jgi:hypothetical protein
MTSSTFSTFEQAAEEVSAIFERLDPDDRRALHVRLLMIGALNAGDLDFIEQVADEAQRGVVNFVRQPRQ